MSPIMARKKPTARADESGADRHAQRSMVRVPDDVYQQLKLLAEQNARPVTWELRLIITEALKKAGLWPPAR